MTTLIKKAKPVFNQVALVGTSGSACLVVPMNREVAEKERGTVRVHPSHNPYKPGTPAFNYATWSGVSAEFLETLEWSPIAKEFYEKMANVSSQSYAEWIKGFNSAYYGTGQPTAKKDQDYELGVAFAQQLADQFGYWK